MRVEIIEGRAICIKGIGELFYQDGFPISMSVFLLKQEGIEVSILHVADECLKNGWSLKTTLNKITADFEEGIHGDKIDEGLLRQFCYSSYEEQRSLIFNYLFKSRDSAYECLKQLIC